MNFISKMWAIFLPKPNAELTPAASAPLSDELAQAREAKKREQQRLHQQIENLKNVQSGLHSGSD